LRNLMIERKRRREKNLPRYMAPTDSTLPSATHRFFIENHTENGEVIHDLQMIEDFVDELGGQKKL